jgi:hypothetical protein
VSSAFVAACLLIGLSLVLPPTGVFTTAAGQFVLVAVMCLIPVSIGIAITRYRLYEIDRIINRTATYAVLTALLVGVYGAVAVVPAVVFDVRSDLLVAAATLAATALFRPLHRRVQAAVDHRFNRRRYDAVLIAEAFTARLRGQPPWAWSSVTSSTWSAGPCSRCPCRCGCAVADSHGNHPPVTSSPDRVPVGTRSETARRGATCPPRTTRSTHRAGAVTRPPRIRQFCPVDASEVVASVTASRKRQLTAQHEGGRVVAVAPPTPPGPARTAPREPGLHHAGGDEPADAGNATLTTRSGWIRIAGSGGSSAPARPRTSTPRGRHEGDAGDQVHRRQQCAGRGVVRRRQGSAGRHDGDHGSRGHHDAHPPAGTPSGQREDRRADGERQQRGQDHQDDPDLERVADGWGHQEADVRRSSAGPQRHVGGGRRQGADRGHLEGRTAARGGVQG